MLISRTLLVIRPLVFLSGNINTRTWKMLFSRTLLVMWPLWLAAVLLPGQNIAGKASDRNEKAAAEP